MTFFFLLRRTQGEEPLTGFHPRNIRTCNLREFLQAIPVYLPRLLHGVRQRSRRRLGSGKDGEGKGKGTDSEKGQ